MKFTLYPLLSCLTIASVVFSCTDHRFPELIPSCPIVQETIKKDYTGTGTPPNSETITFEGSTYGLPAGKQTFVLAPTETHTYTYNSQKLLSQENIVYNSSNSATTYEYNVSTIKQSEFTGGILTKETSYSLNSQSLIGSIINGNTTYKYDANGYLIETTELSPTGVQKTTYTIDNGNVIKKEITNPNFKLTTVYTYDLTKDNLPAKKLFEGRPNRNLLIKSSQDYQQFDVNLYTNFTSTFSYTYDKQGKIQRKLEVMLYKSGVGGINPNAAGTPSISTTDYTYACQ
ncbi:MULTISPECIES: hypothetical protein [unclassified Spirosoma]|uniref:hypothetical protein n=1 Tax=unclassified Spirosoma TaxID=2621999 RepID=UPI00095CE7FC|nr:MULTISPECIES: hypothetical protein [unclassified Spirosoma]MBN8823510.1 hypothetical protein [Spirosoma sp.]OJW71882.1 MAG: hypothetical protein BGO59_16690 [Spirosoma sp. 48-14]